MTDNNILKQKLIEYLTDKLCYIYCTNYKFGHILKKEYIKKYQYYGCDECYRNYMGWELSDESAEEIADYIISLTEEINDR